MSDPRPTRPVNQHSIEVPRTARYFTIGDEKAAVDELWFVLHGFGQLASDFVNYFGDLADRRCLVVAPEALNRYYTVGTSVPAHERPVGATWMTREDRENEIKDYVRYLDLLHERIAARHPGARTVVVGFSQGGATASRWALMGRSKIHRVILWGATLPPDAALSDANSFRGARLTMVVGRKDNFITPSALAAERARLAGIGLPFDVLEYDGGHSIKRSVLETLST